MRVLVLNSGSSSLKASLVQSGSREAERATTERWDADHAATIRRVIASLSGDSDFDAIAHRVVHGGSAFQSAVVVDQVVIDALGSLVELAPLHNATALDVITEARRVLPDVPHVACFDSAFHSTMPEVAWRYPVPTSWSEWGVRKYGFHGLSVEWSVREAARLLHRAPSQLSVAVAHLGSGCSVTAVHAGQSIWTSMGFTPLEGMMMGTRSGSIDPGLLLYLLRSGRLQLDELDEALEKGSGLLGVSGSSADMRELRVAADSGDVRAGLAIEMFVARAAESIAAAMTWLTPDALVFTGGIGENDGRTRDAITARITATHADNTPRVLVVAAREDVVMADQAATLLGRRDG
jgi:acetate kinase